MVEILRGSALRLCAVAGLVCAAPMALAETPGKDGARTVSGTDVILNEYGVIAGAANAGATFVDVTSLGITMPSLAPGDLVMVYQAQGASINGDINSSVYGSVTSLGAAGRYEYQTVASVAGGRVTFETYGGSCGGLVHSYAVGKAQLIRVPQYSTLSVPAGASVAALPWDGARGGVLALDVQNQALINGTLSVAGRGFRGGVADNLSGTARGNGPVTYATPLAENGAEKGESIAGFQDDYPGGRFGRGAPANGGGGGNRHNAGGGGGANGDSGVLWNGQGNPSNSDPQWAQAWNLDPTLNANTTSSGGGRGGYTFTKIGNPPRNPLTTPPGAWPNDKRRELGGLGGRPLTYERTGRIYFGGGGGAGDGNNSSSSDGGRGGGLAFLMAGTVAGGGSILADGAAGPDTKPNHNDAPGGGGGGGTIVIKTDQLQGVSLSARGASGGSQFITTEESEGPGGGGGGGVIAYAGGQPGATVVTGGINGITTSTTMVDFPPNGATRGGTGQPNALAPSKAEIPFCFAPLAAELTGSKTVAHWLGSDSDFSIPGSEVVYTITVNNPGTVPVDADSIVIEDPLPPEVTYFSGEFDPAGPVTGPVEFSGNGSGLVCCNTRVDYGTNAAAGVYGYTPAGPYDPAVRRLRVQPGGTMAAQSSFSISFRARIK